MIDVPREFWRPMPEERIAAERAAIPIPFHRSPELRDAIVKIAFCICVAMEILTRSEQTFDKERSFDEIAGVVEHAENRKARPCVSIHEVRPHAVIARSCFEERDDLLHAREAFVARYESAIDADDERHDAEAARAGGNDTIVAGNILERGSGVGMRALVVITEAFFLNHGEKFVVG